MNGQQRFGQHASVPAVELWPGVSRRTLVSGERMMVCEITLLAGSLVPPHNHPHEQAGYVAAGRLEFTVGAETRVLDVGDGYAIPGGTVHSVRALTDSIAIDVFSPPREEYRS